MTEYTLIHNIIGYCSATVMILFGVLLALMPVPYSKEWKSVRDVRLYLIIPYLILGVATFVSRTISISSGVVGMSDIMRVSTLFISFFQALLFTMTNLVFIRSKYVNKVNIIRNLLFIVLSNLLLFICYGGEYHKLAIYILSACYLGQLIYFFTLFRSEYKKCLHRLEEYYDDDEVMRIGWIKNCFYSALTIGVMSLLVVVFSVSLKLYDCFVVIYTFYYAYIVSRFYNYRIKANFIVNMTSKTYIEPVIIDVTAELLGKEQDELEEKLDLWIENKRFLDKDIAVDDIVNELGVSRREFTQYFTINKQTTFRSWRLGLRIEEAARIIREDENVSISQIHDLVGINDRSNFYRHFQQTFGVTPSQYKAKSHSSK